jgi:hypothetical protein
MTNSSEKAKSIPKVGYIKSSSKASEEIPTQQTQSENKYHSPTAEKCRVPKPTGRIAHLLAFVTRRYNDMIWYNNKHDRTELITQENSDARKTDH